MVPSERLNEAYRVAPTSIGELIDRADAFDIRITLLDTIFSTPPNEMYIVERVDDFARWNIQVAVDDTGWARDPMGLARACTNIPTWKTGARAIARVAQLFSVTRNGEPWDPFQVRRDLAARVVQAPPSQDDRFGARYFYTQTIDYEFDEFCILEVCGPPDPPVRSLFLSNSTPEAAIRAIRKSHIGGTHVGRFEALPPDVLVSRLPRVPSP